MAWNNLFLRYTSRIADQTLPHNTTHQIAFETPNDTQWPKVGQNDIPARPESPSIPVRIYQNFNTNQYYLASNPLLLLYQKRGEQ
jgi:hypothetical protein